MEITDFDPAATGTPMLDEIRRTAERRLREITPLIDEADRLREVLAVIDREQAAERPRRARRAETAPRAPKGSNKRLILDLVGERPGITPAEISDTTGLKRTVVASTVSRLKRCGELHDYEQGGVCLPAPAGAATAAAPSQHLGAAEKASNATSKSGKRPRQLAPVA